MLKKSIFIFIYIFFYITYPIFGEKIYLKDWYFRKTEHEKWKFYDIKKSLKDQNMSIQENDFIYYKTSINKSIIKYKQIGINFGKIEGICDFYINNGSTIFSNKYYDREIFFQINKSLLVHNENELVIKIKKNYPSCSTRLLILPYIDELEKIQQYHFFTYSFKLITGFGILIIGIYFFLFFSKQLKNYSYIIFFILCFCIFLYSVIRSQLRFFLIDNLNIEWIILKKVEYILMINSIAFMSLFFILNFSNIKKYHLILNKIIYTLTILCSVVILFTKFEIMRNMLTFSRLQQVLSFYLSIEILYRNKKRNIEIIYIILGSILCIAFIFLDVIEPQMFNKYPFSVLGVFIFIFCIGIYLSKLFVKISLNLKDMTINLERKVQERTQKLKDVTEQKTNFFINLAHETKTPLTLISNYLNKDINNRGSSKDIQIVEQNINKLKNDMVNYLDIEKLEKGIDFYHHDQVVEVNRIIRQKIMLFKEIAGKKNIKILQKIPTEKVYTKIDPYALDRVMNNLLDNAVRYTDQDGEIKVSVQTDSENLQIHINDTGKGIPEDKQENIFQPYYQISHEKSNIQGIGMGLAIVKKIIDSVSGKINITSEINKGTDFRITVNRFHPQSQDEITKIEIHKKPADTISTTELKKESGTASGTAQQFTVFLVEDNRDIIQLLQDNLEKQYNFFYAINGKQALKKLITIPKPHLIIIDIMMDEMDGIEFYDKFLKLNEYNDIPVIFLTAKNIPELKIEQMKKGAIDYIAKPFDLKDTILKIDSIIQSHEKAREAKLKEIIAKIMNESDTTIKSAEDIIKTDNLCQQYNISLREREIIALVKAGKTSQEIAWELGISDRTVTRHLDNIYKKCRVHNRIELTNLFNSSQN